MQGVGTDTEYQWFAKLEEYGMVFWKDARVMSPRRVQTGVLRKVVADAGQVIERLLPTHWAHWAEEFDRVWHSAPRWSQPGCLGCCASPGTSAVIATTCTAEVMPLNDTVQSLQGKIGHKRILDYCEYVAAWQIGLYPSLVSSKKISSEEDRDEK